MRNILFFFILCSAPLFAQEVNHGAYLFPNSKNLQWAVSQIGQPFTPKTEKKLKKISKSGVGTYYKGRYSSLAFDTLTMWSSETSDKVELRLYYKDNICVKMQATVPLLFLKKNNPKLPEFAFINAGKTDPETVRNTLEREKLPFFEEVFQITDEFYRRTFFAKYEPKNWLINIYTTSINENEEIQTTHYVSVAAEGIDNSEPFQYILNDALYDKIDVPKSYAQFDSYLERKEKEKRYGDQLATLNLAPENNIIDLTKGICLDGCEENAEKSTIHYGNYVYIGPTKEYLPHNADKSGAFYELIEAYKNKIGSYDYYTTNPPIECVILSGYCYLDYIDFDTKTGIAVTQPFEHPILKKDVYARVQLVEGDKIDTTLAELHISRDFSSSSLVYKGKINRNLEMHGEGDFLYEREGYSVIVRTRWKNNRVDQFALRSENFDSPNGFKSQIISNGGLHVDMNMEFLAFDSITESFVCSSDMLVKLNYEKSVLEFTNAQPTMRIIGAYGYENNKQFIYGKHQKQKYKGSGALSNAQNWEDIALSVLGSKQNEESCFVSGSNFYELPQCSSQETWRVKNQKENQYGAFGFFGF